MMKQNVSDGAFDNSAPQTDSEAGVLYSKSMQLGFDEAAVLSNLACKLPSSLLEMSLPLSHPSTLKQQRGNRVSPPVFTFP